MSPTPLPVLAMPLLIMRGIPIGRLRSKLATETLALFSALMAFAPTVIPILLAALSRMASIQSEHSGSPPFQLYRTPIVRGNAKRYNNTQN